MQFCVVFLFIEAALLIFLPLLFSEDSPTCFALSSLLPFPPFLHLPLFRIIAS